jgi:hypothetical protein
MKREQSTGKMPVGPTAGMAVLRSAGKRFYFLTDMSCRSALTMATNTINLHRQQWSLNRLDDLARDWGIFVERVGGTEAMVAVGDDRLGGRVVPDEKERR